MWSKVRIRRATRLVPKRCSSDTARRQWQTRVHVRTIHLLDCIWDKIMHRSSTGKSQSVRYFLGRARIGENWWRSRGWWLWSERDILAPKARRCSAGLCLDADALLLQETRPIENNSRPKYARTSVRIRAPICGRASEFYIQQHRVVIT